MKKILLSSAVVTGLLASSVFAGGGAAWAVAPATPYTLAATDSLYIIDTEGSGIYETTASGEMTLLDLQLNPSTGGFFPAGALNPMDNKAYLVFVDQTNGDDFCYLDQVDVLGGAPAARVQVKGAEEPFDCFGLNIDAAGNALIYGEWDDNSGGPWLDSVWKLNLATGALSDRVDIDTSLFGFTVSPDGQWYGLHDDGTLVQIDSASGASTQLVSTTLNDVYDLKFDSQGTLWFTNNNSSPYQLYSWRAGDSDYTLQGDTSIGGDSSSGLFGPTFVGKSTVTITEEAKAPQLSNTGLNQSVVISAALAGVGLVVVGLLALMLIRRRRHS